MPEKAPPLQPGKVYHLHSRGNNGENIFIEERNYAHFLALYVRHFAPVADTYAYCLLRNHFHFLVRIRDDDNLSRPQGFWKPLGSGKDAHVFREPLGSVEDQLSIDQPLGSGKKLTPSQAFSNFLNAYAKAINKAYGRSGSLFQSRFSRHLVENQAYFLNIIAYIHRNPQDHHFVPDFRDWPYSSYGIILAEKETYLERNAVLHAFGERAGYLTYHAQELDFKPIVALLGDDWD